MTTGVLVMSYGTPRGLDDVEAYYTDIRHGRPPTAEQLHALTQRYQAIGGRSPLLEITQQQARGISERTGMPVYVGQKHAAPFISDAVAQMNTDGIDRAVGLVLAPHFSSMSIGDYARRADLAAEEIGWTGSIHMIESWHLEPGFIDLLAGYCKDALSSVPASAHERTTFVFTAHSLPEAILRKGDPYPEQLRETADAVARQLGLARWQIGWQSAGRTSDAWLGPDILEILGSLAADGEQGVVVCPCGFVADHLEVLYDLDIEAKQRAAELDLAFARTRSPNDDPDFLDVLAAIVTRALQSS
ncbi:MAG: ferrochelatase [Actinobacteria bacterium]|nr:ferrochelatase [Actinomycetota bacterium]